MKCGQQTGGRQKHSALVRGTGDGLRGAQRKTEGAWDVRRALRAWWHGFENFERSVSKL